MTEGASNDNRTPTADRQVYLESQTMYRIPGRDFDRGEITHKTLDEMNRQERRAVLASQRRMNRGRWS
jgi:hypothetical protein